MTAVVCSSLSAFIAARITDKMYGHLKVTIMVFLGISSLFFLWFLLLTTKVIYPTLGKQINMTKMHICKCNSNNFSCMLLRGIDVAEE